MSRVRRVQSIGYRIGTGFAGRLGLDDLAWLSAERAISAAGECDQADLEVATSLRYLVWGMVRQGRFAEAEHIATAAAERIQPTMLDREPARIGVFGNLLLNAATAAQRAGNAARAVDLLAEARAAAVRVSHNWADETATTR